MLSNYIIHDSAKFGSLMGAGLSSVFGSALGDAIGQVRQFSLAILGSVGIETVFSAFSTYQGMRQIYVLNRLYSHMRAKKITAESKGVTFNAFKALCLSYADSTSLYKLGQMEYYSFFHLVFYFKCFINS